MRPEFQEKKGSLEKTFFDFKNWVKSIKNPGYKVAYGIICQQLCVSQTVLNILRLICKFVFNFKFFTFRKGFRSHTSKYEISVVSYVIENWNLTSYCVELFNFFEL